MGAFRIAIIATAALAAILLAFLVRGMLAPKHAPAPAPVVAAAPQKPMAQVLTAKRDLPVGTRIGTADLAWQPWPVDALNASFVTNGATPVIQAKGAEKAAQTAAQATHDLMATQGPMQAFEGAIVKEAMVQGEPVIARKVVRGGQSGYMAVVLLPGMRAMAVPINAESAVGGFVLPGDRVDVLQSRAGPDGKGFITETLMRNLRVLAIDQKTEPGKDAKSMVGTVAVLEVPAADTLVIARGKAQGEMHLALRSYADLGGGAGPGNPERGGTVLRLYRGGQVSEVVSR